MSQRKTKFRAKIAGTDRWLYNFGFYPTKDDGIVFLDYEEAVELFGEDFIDEHGEAYDDIVYFNVEAVCQYTGLKDNKGVNIIEPCVGAIGVAVGRSTPRKRKQIEGLYGKLPFIATKKSSATSMKTLTYWRKANG